MTVSYNKLWKILIDNKMNKSDLKKTTGVSWGSVTKMSKNENVSMHVLIKVCKILGCNVDDIMDILPSSPIPTYNPTSQPQIIVKPSIGSTIKFGKYDWRVLDIQGDKALLLSDKLTHTGIPYNKEYTGVTWEKCTLRKWLNSEFLTQEFTPQEQSKIALTTIQNENNQWYGTKGGNATNDRIFLLSISEVVKYFGDSGQLRNRPAKGSYYINDQNNEARIAYDANKSSKWWWLRSPGFLSHHTAHVVNDGWVILHGGRVDNGNRSVGVRPALFLNL